MNTQEFKAWFAGFTESTVGLPSVDQWTRVLEEIARLTPIFTPTMLTNPFPHQPTLMNPGVLGVDPSYWQARA